MEFQGPNIKHDYQKGLPGMQHKKSGVVSMNKEEVLVKRLNKKNIGCAFMVLSGFVLTGLTTGSGDSEFSDPHFFTKKDWIIFLLNYILFIVGFLLYNSYQKNISNPDLKFLAYCSGFFVLAALWEIQKFIPGVAGWVICYAIYVVGFFYVLGFGHFANR